MTARVLLAEDDVDHAFFTERAFHDAHGASAEVHTVRDGEQVLDYLHRRGDFADAQRPHLIVLDLKMPKVDGLEVLAQIKADEALRRIPIVVLTSSDRPQDVKESYERHANSYVTKPATLTGLREGVAGLARYWLDVATLPNGHA